MRGVLAGALALLVTGCSGGVATFVVVHDTGDAGASSTPLADEHRDAAQGAGDDGGAAVQPSEDAQASAPDAYMTPEHDAGPDAFPDGSITVVTPPPDHTGMVQACCPQSSVYGCQYLVIGGGSSSGTDKAIAPGACEWVPRSDSGMVYENPNPNGTGCPACVTGNPCLKSDGVSCGCTLFGACN